MSSARIVCLSRALSPITHMGGVAGNEALLNRLPVRLPDGTERRVPFVSGNAVRHVSFRAPGMTWLVDEYGLRRQLSLAQLNYLFHGGALTESTGREDTAGVAEMHEAWPILRLLGGAKPSQIDQGSLRVGHAYLCCEETRDTLTGILGDEVLDGLPPLLPAESFVRPYQYATYDAVGREPHLAAHATGEAPKRDTRMLYTGESVQPGAYFAHDYTILDPTTVEVGCVLWSLELWRRAGGVVGGMGAKGHGKLDTRILLEGCDDHDPATLVADYLRHARAMRERAAAWLHSVFSPKAKAKAAGKGKAKKADPEPTPDPAPFADAQPELWEGSADGAAEGHG